MTTGRRREVGEDGREDTRIMRWWEGDPVSHADVLFSALLSPFYGAFYSFKNNICSVNLKLNLNPGLSFVQVLPPFVNSHSPQVQDAFLRFVSRPGCLLCHSFCGNPSSLSFGLCSFGCEVLFHL